MNQFKLTLIAFLSICTVSQVLFAQSTESNDSKVKIKIITKDANGNIEKVEEEYSGTEAESFDLKKMLEEMQSPLENLNIDIEQLLNSTEDLKDIKIKMFDMDGENFKWEKNGKRDFDLKNFESWKDIKSFSHKGGYLGVYLKEEVNDKNGEVSSTGVLIDKIVEESAAGKAGLEVGDEITRIDKVEIESTQQLIDMLREKEAGEEVFISYVRDGKNKSTKVTLGERPMEFRRSRGYSKSGGCNGMPKKICIPSDCCPESTLEDVDEMLKDLFSDTEVFEEVEIIEENGKTIKRTIRTEVITEEVIRDDFDSNDPNVAIEEIITENELSLSGYNFFPNPNDGEFNLQFNLNKKDPVTVKVIDLSGKTIYKDRIRNFNGTYGEQIELKNVTDGTYLLQILQNDQVFVDKIIVNSAGSNK